jgi:Ca2+ transporting ATPase
MDTPWTKTPEEILQYYAVDPTSGLSPDQAAKHAELYGKNGVLCTSL